MLIDHKFSWNSKSFRMKIYIQDKTLTIFKMIYKFRMAENKLLLSIINFKEFKWTIFNIHKHNLNLSPTQFVVSMKFLWNKFNSQLFYQINQVSYRNHILVLLFQLLMNKFCFIQNSNNNNNSSKLNLIFVQSKFQKLRVIKANNKIFL